MGPLGLQACECFAHDDQAHVHIGQAHAHRAIDQLALVVVAAAHARKGVQAVTADGQQLGLHGLAVAEGDALAARDDGKFTMHGHKAGDVQVQNAARLPELAVVAIQAEGETLIAIGHGEHGGAGAVVQHQGAGGLSRRGDGAARLHGLQGNRLEHGFVGGHQGLHIGAQQAAAKAQLQLTAGEKVQADRGAGDAGQRGVKRGLHLVLRHVGAQHAGGDRLAAVGQAQGVVDLSLGAGNDHALQLAGGRLALGQVGGRDHGQAKVAGRVAG